MFFGEIRAISLSFFLFSASGAAMAQGDCRQEFLSLADGICGEFVNLRGGSTSSRAGAGLNATVKGLVGRLVDLGGNVEVERTTQAYENLLQKDLPGVMAHGRNCRIEVAKLFYNQVCGATTAAPAIRAAPPQGSAVDRAFSVAAVPDRYPPYANVFSGPGQTYPIKYRLTTNMRFYTHRQNGDWWQVRFSNGAGGYMHISRIRLLE